VEAHVCQIDDYAIRKEFGTRQTNVMHHLQLSIGLGDFLLCHSSNHFASLFVDELQPQHHMIELGLEELMGHASYSNSQGILTSLLSYPFVT
jgi:hypothetical protein